MIKKSGAVIDGYIEVKRFQGKNKPIINIHHNTMSEHAQNVLLSLSASLLLNGGSPTPFNRLSGTTPGLYLPTEAGSPTSGAAMFYDESNSSAKTDGLTVVFLKLDDKELSELNASSKYLPIKDINNNISDKVVAYGVYELINEDKKTGVITFSDPSKLVENYSCANAWLFSADKEASFEYNVIAIVSLAPYSVFSAYKCISRCDVLNSDNKLTNHFIIPGFTGVTGPNEIILDYTYNGINRWKYNLKTGVTEPVESNEIGYNINMEYMNGIQVVYDDKLFSLYLTSSGYDSSVYKYTNTGDRSSLYVSINTSNQHVRGMFTDGEDLYISCTGNGSSYNGTMNKYDKLNDRLTIIANDSFDKWGGIPESWNKNTTYVKSSFVVNDHRYYVVGNIDKGVQYIISDLMNIEGSIVAEAPLFDCLFSIDNTEEGVFFLLAGTKNKSVNVSPSSANDRKHGALTPPVYIKGQSSGYKENNYRDSGVWINNNSFANFLSFEKYTSTQHKEINQNLTVTYGYEIGIR